jgi:hypothetical protein
MIGLKAVAVADARRYIGILTAACVEGRKRPESVNAGARGAVKTTVHEQRTAAAEALTCRPIAEREN